MHTALPSGVWKQLVETLHQSWIKRSIIVISVTLMGICIIFSVIIGNSYYASVRNTLMSKAKTASSFFSRFLIGTYSEYYDAAQNYTKNFDDADKLELQFMNLSGDILISSTGLTAGTNGATPDIQRAISTQQPVYYIGTRALTNERIIAVSTPLIHQNGTVIGIIRYVSGLRKLDVEVAQTVLTIFMLGVVVFLVVLLLEFLFIRQVAAPVVKITKLCSRISSGSYGTQIENHYKEEIHEMVDSINEMSMQLARSETVQTEFISSVSHELRTPLTAITGWGETLVYGENLDEDTRRGIEIILKEAKRLTKMVEDLLNFTRMSEGRFALRIEQVSLPELVWETISSYSELVKSQNIKLEYSAPDEELPQIPADPSRLRQVFINILDNATKYGKKPSPDGESAPCRIVVSVGSAGDSQFVSFRDFGSGVPEDELQFINQKFFKGSNFSERGSGIGLSVCDEIVSFHGGVLLFENMDDEEGGFEVTVILPVK
ncbi:MAG: sensor histidine kinase [Oscillospiraceae bacterium]|jgi:signal transduction histidine kinase|nr:sensor histidine kinase [Oscillospiraceae bacterium]